jgi:arsenite methyltransferase
MASRYQTSTGHALSDATWLDAHYQSSQLEYEEALKYVGIERGWNVLDAGCGGGGFLPVMADLVGANGSVVAMDLAPENVAHVATLVSEGKLPGVVRAEVGSLTSLPCETATFDGVWTANVFQYLTEVEAKTAIEEMTRVLKPNGLLAIKEFDNSTFDFLPMSIDASSRLMIERRVKAAASGRLSAGSGPSLPARLRSAGLSDIRRKSWLVERWAPLGQATRTHVTNVLRYFAGIVDQYDIPEADRNTWREAAANSEGLMNEPDFCYREGFVVAVGRKAH